MGIVLVFARDPRDERWAKPLRVARDLRRAVEGFHRAALDRTLEAAVESGAAVRLCTTRDPERALDAGVEVARQRSGSLGERLAYAFAEAFHDGYHQVVLVGGDAPEIGSRHLLTAFTRLNEARGSTAVLGPAPDGGYWLLGLNGFTAAPFQEMPWKTPRLQAATREALERAHFAVEELEELADVDGFRDLERLAARLRGRDDALELRAAALAVIADAVRDSDDPPRGGLARLVLSALRPKGPLPV